MRDLLSGKTYRSSTPVLAGRPLSRRSVKRKRKLSLGISALEPHNSMGQRSRSWGNYRRYRRRGRRGLAQNPVTNPVAQPPASNRNGIQLVDFKQDGGAHPAPQPGSPQPTQPPNFLDRYKNDLISPGPQPPATGPYAVIR